VSRASDRRKRITGRLAVKKKLGRNRAKKSVFRLKEGVQRGSPSRTEQVEKKEKVNNLLRGDT